jgi:hypothetical protein
LIVYFVVVVFLFDQVMVFVAATEVPWAGAVPASAAMAPFPLHPETIWLVAVPVRLVQLTVRGAAAVAVLPGMATAANDAEPASAAQASSRMGR